MPASTSGAGPSGSTPSLRASATLTSVEPGIEPLSAAHRPRLGHYELQSELGRGGVGVVFAAFDHRLTRRVALKQLLRLDPRSRRRFEREMRITAHLQHPGVVPIHEAGAMPTGEPFYVMRLVEGTSLRTHLKNHTTLVARLRFLPNVLAVAETIAYAHSRRIIHRDLKPANIIVGDYGETIVIDWGLAKELDRELDDDDPLAPPGRSRRSPAASFMTMPGQVLGTPAYMSPEQARGIAVDERTDVYALGAILFTVLVGRPPFDGLSTSETIAALVNNLGHGLRQLAADAPELLVSMVERCLQRDPAGRYPSAATLATDLRAFLEGQQPLHSGA